MASKVKLSDKALKDLSFRIQNDRSHGWRERDRWEEKLPLWRQMYEGIVEDAKEPWPDAHNQNVDFIGDQVDEFVARGMNAMFSDPKWAPAVPVEDFDEERWPVVEQFMQWALQAELKAWGDFEAIFQETAINGTCFVYTFWERKLRRTREQRYFPNSIPQAEGQRRKQPTDRELLQLALGALLKKSSRKRGKDHYTVELVEDGRKHEAKVWIERNPMDREGEVLVEIEREEVVYDAPRIRILEPDDVYDTDVGDLQNSPFLHIEQQVTIDWMARRRAQGFFPHLSDEDWQRIKSTQTEFKKQVDRQHSQVKRVKDEVVGQDTGTQVSHTRPMLTCFYRYDLDGDGFEEEAVIEYDLDTKTILSVDYLDRRFPHGRRPVTVFRYRQIANRIRGVGIPEHLWNTQITINSLLNSALNAAELRNRPPRAYNKASGLEGHEFYDLAQGDALGVVGNPHDILWESQAGANQDHLLPFVKAVMDFGDRRIGRFSVLPGGDKKTGSGTGFPRTFGGQTLVMTEGLIRLDHQIRHMALGGQGVASGFNELFHQIFDLYASLMPQKKKFRVIGDGAPHIEEVMREDLRNRPDFMFSANMLTSNAAVRQQTALMLFQTVAPQLAQFGALDKWRNILKRLYRAFGIPNSEELTPEIPNMLPRAPMEPDTENFIMLQGTPWDPLPVDDDAVHLQEHMRFKQDNLERFMPQAWMEFDQHLAKHIQQQQQKEQAAATQAGNGGGRPMGGERRLPGQARPPRGGGGEILAG
jgi:hypothetical protein